MSECCFRFDGKIKVCLGNKGEVKGEVGGEEEEEERGKEIYYFFLYLFLFLYIMFFLLNFVNFLSLVVLRFFKMVVVYVNI